MRFTATGLVLLAIGIATAAHGEVRVADASQPPLRPAATLIARLGAADRAQAHDSRLHIRLGHVSPIRTVAGGIDASPFVTALPGEMWHGRLRSFGRADGIGFSGIAVRARSVGFSALQSEHHVSGFLASELRYGVALDRDDLLTVDLNAASQRLPAAPTLGIGKSVHISSVYLGAALVHDGWLTLTGGWYRLSASTLSPLEYAVERAAGMPAAGQGYRLGLDMRLGPAGTVAPARIGFELRDSDADRDRMLGVGYGAGRERRMLLRFTEPF